jgi:hypothetical protein
MKKFRRKLSKFISRIASQEPKNTESNEILVKETRDTELLQEKYFL